MITAQLWSFDVPRQVRSVGARRLLNATRGARRNVRYKPTSQRVTHQGERQNLRAFARAPIALVHARPERRKRSFVVDTRFTHRRV